MPSRLSNFELTYLDSILVVSTIVVIAEGETNYRLRTGDDLPDGGEVIVVGILLFFSSARPYGSLSPVEGLLYQISGTSNSTFALCYHPEPAPPHYLMWLCSFAQFILDRSILQMLNSLFTYILPSDQSYH